MLAGFRNKASSVFKTLYRAFGYVSKQDVIKGVHRCRWWRTFHFDRPLSPGASCDDWRARSATDTHGRIPDIGTGGTVLNCFYGPSHSGRVPQNTWLARSLSSCSLPQTWQGLGWTFLETASAGPCIASLGLGAAACLQRAAHTGPSCFKEIINTSQNSSWQGTR